MLGTGHLFPMGRGGLQHSKGGGHIKFYPYEKGGDGESFSHVEGGGHKKFPLFKRGGGRKKFYPILPYFGPAIFPFCRPPSP